MHILHLMKHGAGEVALNFVKRIRPILNSGSAKQKLKEVHSTIRSFWRSSDNTRSGKPETVYTLSHNCNEKIIKYKKDLEFSTSKNSMRTSNSSAKRECRCRQKKRKWKWSKRWITEMWKFHRFFIQYTKQKQSPGVVLQKRCVFLEISQNSQKKKPVPESLF